jgi:hypothetical protein
VSKFREHAVNTVITMVCCVRIPSLTTDIVISFNSPSEVNPESSSASTIDVETQRSASAHAAAIFHGMIASFVIADVGAVVG